MNKLPVGLYDLLHTKKLNRRLKEAGLLDRAVWSNLSPEEIHHRLALPLSREITDFIRDVVSKSHHADWIDELEKALQSQDAIHSILNEIQLSKAETLQQLIPPPPLAVTNIRPDTPLSESALLTGSSRSLSLRSQLIKELANCNRADWLVSFIKYAGILPLLPTLQEFT